MTNKTGIRRSAHRMVGSHNRLTPAEKATHELMEQGMSHDEIAAKLGVGKQSLRIRIGVIMEKLRAK